MLTTVHFVLIKLKLQNSRRSFYDCTFSCTFWEDLNYCFFLKFEDLPVLTKYNILFGLFLKDETHDLAINTIIILGKFFLHKNRFLKILPNFYIYHKEIAFVITFCRWT